MSSPNVSILIPVYNASLFIERCANSVFSQTFSSIEYVFVDDGSVDDSIHKLEKVLNNYPNRQYAVQILKHQVNKGISAARQTALDHASGQYVFMMDSDDYVENNLVEMLYNKAVSCKSDLVYCPFFVEYENKSDLSSIYFSNNNRKMIDQAIKGNASYWNKLISRSLLVNNNIRTLDGIDYGDDLAVLVKVIYYARNICYLPFPLYHYVQYNTDSCTKKFKLKYIDDRLIMVDYISNFLESVPDAVNYRKSIWLLKATRKERLLRLMGPEDRFIGLYPEINHHIFSVDIKLSSKILLLLSRQKFKKILKIYIKLLKQ
ncbi:MAG: glycosyltransferase family 2 protein [Paludibacter sp.]|nr:glycosyltransferase family 2 protein [Paludibacter sp.]